MTGWIVTFDPDLRVDMAMGDIDDRGIMVFLKWGDASDWAAERNLLGASIVEVVILPKAEPRPPEQAGFHPFVL